MALDLSLLEILACPVTKQSVSILSEQTLRELNKRIVNGEVSTVSGERLFAPLEQALITQNKNIVYPVIDGVPIMLEEQSIAMI